MQISWKKAAFVVLILSVLATTIGYYLRDAFTIPAPSETTRLDEVGRVLMHEPGVYTLLVEETDGTISLRTFGGYNCGSPVTLYHDAPPDKPMWAEYRTVYGPKLQGERSQCEQLISIHLHSAEAINGAGWDHGKFGSGQTTVVE